MTSPRVALPPRFTFTPVSESFKYHSSGRSKHIMRGQKMASKILSVEFGGENNVHPTVPQATYSRSPSLIRLTATPTLSCDSPLETAGGVLHLKISSNSGNLSKMSILRIRITRD